MTGGGADSEGATGGGAASGSVTCGGAASGGVTGGGAASGGVTGGRAASGGSTGGGAVRPGQALLALVDELEVEEATWFIYRELARSYCHIAAQFPQKYQGVAAQVEFESKT